MIESGSFAPAVADAMMPAITNSLFFIFNAISSNFDIFLIFSQWC